MGKPVANSGATTRPASGLFQLSRQGLWPKHHHLGSTKATRAHTISAARMRSCLDFGRVRQSARTPKQSFGLLLPRAARKTMSSRWTSVPATLLLMLLLTAAPLPSLAQAELENFVKRYDELFQAGNYDAALAEARKFESA